MKVQSTDSHEWLLRSLVTIGLLCAVGTYALADEEQAESETVPSTLMSTHPNLPPQTKIKTLKIQGALAALHDARPGVQSQALEALDDLNALDQIPSDFLPRLAQLLTANEARISALKILGKLGESAAEFLPQIGALLFYQEPAVRVAAITAVGKLGVGWEAVYCSQLEMLLDDPERSVRLAALRALDKLDSTGQSYLPVIQERLQSADAGRRVEAVIMLENLGESVEAHIQEIIYLLEDSDPDVRRAAINALGNLAIPDSQAIARIAERLSDQEWRIRVAATRSLCRMPPFHQKYMPQILALLSDTDERVHIGVIGALSHLGEDLRPYLPEIMKLEKAPNPEVRAAVLDTLGRVGPGKEAHLEFIRERLEDSHWEVRAAAVRALESLPEHSEEVLSLLTSRFRDQDWFVRTHAIKTFGVLARPEEMNPERIQSLLQDEEGSVRAAVVWMLGNWEQHARPYLPLLLTLLEDPHAGVRQAAIRALRNLGQVPLDAVLAVCENIARDPDRTTELRFLAHSIGAGERTVETLLTWVGNPATPPSLDELSYGQAREVLAVFDAATRAHVDTPHVLNRLVDLSGQILIRMQSSWQPRDVPLLSSHVTRLQSMDSPYSVSVRRMMWKLKIQGLLTLPVVRGIGLGILHPLVWLGLCLVYPHVKWVRIVFFWNPYVRWGLGLGYVHFVVLKLAFFRKRFFLPYQRTLLTDADLAHFNDLAYLKDVLVWDEQTQQLRPVHEAIPTLKGKILLEGDPGLGKTLYARYLLKYCSHPVVYLPAEKCTGGIIEAIAPKMRGECRDEGFLRALVCKGGVDLCIDGLDAINPRELAKVTNFLMQRCKGNILITTRPLEGELDKACIVYQLQPLRREQIDQFLRLYYRMLPENVPLSRVEYSLFCDTYVQQTLTRGSLPEEKALWQERAMTTPMNLTLMALLCAYGKTPDLTRLVEQCYHLIAATYQQQNESQPFPLMQFSERIYRMRLYDEGTIPFQRFRKEIQCLRQYHLVLDRASFDGYSKPITEWYFRHEVISDFFVLQAFLEENSHRIDRHVGDPRFHGVYALLKNATTFIDVEAFSSFPDMSYQEGNSVLPVVKTI